MKALIQRVKFAEVKVENSVVASIQHGLLVFLGFSKDDNPQNISKLCSKVLNCRLFNDEEGKMNLSVQDIGGELLVVSQFTLYANTKKGNRPSFVQAAAPEVAEIYYEQALSILEELQSKKVQRGIFGVDMQVSLLNDGPVTVEIEL